MKAIEKQIVHLYNVINNYQVMQDQIETAVYNLAFVTNAQKAQKMMGQIFKDAGVGINVIELTR
jgi:hypothetical protein